MSACDDCYGCNDCGVCDARRGAKGWQSHELAQIEKQRARLFDCLNRFVRAEDETLTTFGLVSVVFERWAEDSNVHLGDPADGVILEKEA